MEHTIAGYKFSTVAGNTLERPIFITLPFNQETLDTLAAIYVKQHSRFWPDDLPASTLVENLKVFYIPLIIRQGRASASWSASVGKYYDTRTSWSQQSGVISTDVDEEVVENYNTAGFGGGMGFSLKKGGGLRPGDNWDDAYKYLKLEDKSPFAARKPIPSLITFDVEVLCPKLSRSEALAAAEDELHKRLKRGAEYNAKNSIDGDLVKGLSLAYERIDGLDVSTWLCPLYLGTYKYKNGNYSISISANGQIILHDAPSRGGECFFIILTIMLALVPTGIMLFNDLQNPNWVLLGLIYVVSCFTIWPLLGFIHIQVRKKPPVSK